MHQSRYQHVKDVFSTASKKFGLQISIIKTEVLFQSGTYHQEEILMDGKALNQFDGFTCLGSTISKGGRIDSGLMKRMSKARSAFWQTTNQAME